MVSLIILSAGSIEQRLPFLEPKSKCPALIPLNTRPLISYILDFYEDKNLSTNLFVSEDHIEEVKNELLLDHEKTSVFSMPKNRGVVESLSMALEKIPEDDEIIVNVVTTIPTMFPGPHEVQVSNELAKYRIGSRVAFEDGETKFMPKKSTGQGSGYPFTGVFRTSYSLLQNSLKMSKSYDDLLEVAKNLEYQRPHSFKKVDWLDCGHEVNFFETKNKIFESRVFNNIEIFSFKGILKKTSSDYEKLRKEASYINCLPSNVQVFFPRIINGFETINERGSFEMEYYGYPNVAEYLLYWNVEEGHWYRMFERIKHVLESFREYGCSIGFDEFRDFYLGKTKDRVETFFEQLKCLGEDINWTEEEVSVNGTKCAPFKDLWPKIEKKVEQLYSEEDFCIMHGDLCFNNILYDLPSGIIRLIDQRGSFGSKNVGIYGDQKYDLAKLAHSAIGNYDYLVNELFSLTRNGNDFRYSFNLRESSHTVANIFKELLSRLGYKGNDIFFIMGLLFVSMCPLHRDSYKKQVTMYVHGLKILNESLVENG